MQWISLEIKLKKRHCTRLNPKPYSGTYYISGSNTNNNRKYGDPDRCKEIPPMGWFFLGCMLDLESLMDLWQVHPMLPLLCCTFSIFKSTLFPSHLWHPSVCPCFPCFILHSYLPVSLIFIPMSPWSSCPSHIVRLPCSCFFVSH